MEIMLFYITCPNESTASEIVQKLIDRKLAACGNIFPIKSEYLWMGVYNNENEFVAIVKSIPAAESKIESLVLKSHPYQTPCIMRWLVQVNDDYGKWVNTCVTG